VLAASRRQQVLRPDEPLLPLGVEDAGLPADELGDQFGLEAPPGQVVLRLEVCLRFFDVNGATVKAPLNERVMSITPAGLMQVPRRVGVAGGAGKCRAIRAALRGAWVNVLVTDLDTARALVEDTEARQRD
jgi:Putative sugar-binding domain